MNEETYKTLDDILRIYFGCKKIFSAKQKRIILEDGVEQYFTKKGYEAYSTASSLIFFMIYRT